jgi:hypothetical protein
MTGTKTATQEDIRVADEAWISLATLHIASPERESFAAKEILEHARSLHLTGDLRPGVQIHICLHNVANIEPNPARHRMFYRLPDRTYRLFRPGDRAHPARSGKTVPNREDVPREYRHLIDWYENDYCRKRRDATALITDPVLQMRGLGKEIWADTSADEYVGNLRAGWDQEGT